MTFHSANKKIALMTWYKYTNYGTALQAYAMQKTIAKLGYEPIFIKYDPTSMILNSSFTYRAAFSRGIRATKALLPSKLKIAKEKNLLFAEFQNQYFKESKKATYGNELYSFNSEFCAFVCGSDQVWSPLNFDPSYFLDFVANPHKKIAYAPSLGVSNLSDSRIQQSYTELLRDFSFLSCRELSGAKEIESLTGKSCKVVLDPTLLLSWDDWKKEFNIGSDCNNKNYCLCYFLGRNSRNMKAAKKIASTLGLKQKIIPVNFLDYGSAFSEKEPIGPKEFLKLINGASYILTDSYHGMLFAVNSETPFIIFDRFKTSDLRCQNSRIDSFIDLFSLEKRRYNSSKFDFNEDINFRALKERIQTFKNNSIAYLSTALNSACQDGENRVCISNTCISCGACRVVCPVNAIETVSEDGYFKSKINYEVCIGCGKCKKVCPFNGTQYTQLVSNKDFLSCLAYKTDSENLLDVSSGGFSYDLSRYAQLNKIPFWGCVYDNELNFPMHKVSLPNNDLDIKNFRGSKYIRSETESSYRSILNDVTAEGIFIGTPCQVAALSGILTKQQREKWILVDLVCYGVPSELLWGRLVSQFENSIYKVNFRDKKRGWHHRSLVIRDSCGKDLYCESEDQSSYYRLYKRGIFNYSSCLECPFRDSSIADIRIGDFWGHYYSHDETGVSMVLSITNKGKEVVTGVLDTFSSWHKEHKPEDYFNGQCITSEKHRFFDVDRNNAIFDLCRNDCSLDELAEKYCKAYELGKKKEATLLPIYMGLKKIIG